MNERAIFIEALDRDTPADRAAFLDEACAGDPTLRERVEALLRSHEEAGDFPGKLAPQRLVDEFAARSDDTRTSPGAGGDDGLDFLAPSDKLGSLGRLGHYEVQAVVGRGGMGVVLKAFDENLHRVLAVKVMAPQLASSATARRRFTREARAAAAVTHDHVVTIHAVEDAGPRPYIVMQYVAGVSLQDRIDRTGPLQLREVLRIGMQAASGLAAAHAQGLVHRDVKPANILLENGVERVKLTDFGLARAADDASLTQPGVVAGTPAFMSPEQAEGKPVDHRSDLFSLGSVLYAMCTGRPPFRSGTNMGVLKRVCEQTPTPIRETNPEVPDWLAAVVEKLHAKDPTGRPRSAAEVAEVLGQHLAQVQHPSAVPLRTVVKPVAGSPVPARPGHRHRWAVAAAVLVTLLVTLATTDATGVTNLRNTIIRVFTPDGTLVVETDDPAVTVTVEGDGGLVITGAGLQEIRLKPGSYRVLAARDGQRVPLDRELVTVSRRGREIVRVKLEAPPAPPGAKGETGAFVLLAAGKERKFETLAEAVLGASDGDTIEIRGNGPFVSDGVTTRHPLAIRAGTNYTPSIALSKTSADKNIPLLFALDALVLEGLELKRSGGAAGPVEGRYPNLLAAWERGSLHVANCRLIYKGDSPHWEQGALFASYGKSLSVRNSVLSGNISTESGGFCASGGRYDIDNCVCAIGGIGFSILDPDARDVAIRIRGNTLVGNCLNLTLFSKPNLPKAGEATPPIHLDCSRNVARWDETTRNKGFLYFHQAQKEPFAAAQAEALLPRLVRLDEKQNVYRKGTPLLQFVADWQSLGSKRGQDLADWDRFWGHKNTGSVEGEIRFQGGDLITRARSAPEQLTAEDFRLRANSAGYQKGEGKKDLGADVNLVGPGPAYEWWKKTPAYQQWLTESGQVKK